MTLPLPQMDPCYLCEVVAGGSAAWNVIEHGELTVTMLNGRQFEIGQCMVVPVRHAPTLLDLNAAEEAAVMAAAKRLMGVIVEEFSPDGVLLYQNNGIGSGQEVPHFHLHVVPRRLHSDWGSGPPQLAPLEQAPRPAKLDHTMLTEQKRRTVEQLRRYYA